MDSDWLYLPSVSAKPTDETLMQGRNLDLGLLDSSPSCVVSWLSEFT